VGRQVGYPFLFGMKSKKPAKILLLIVAILFFLFELVLTFGRFYICTTMSRQNLLSPYQDITDVVSRRIAQREFCDDYTDYFLLILSGAFLGYAINFLKEKDENS